MRVPAEVQVPLEAAQGDGAGEEPLPLEQRDAVRARALAATPGYRPWLHFGTESFIGLSICAAAAWLARDAGPWHLLFGAGLLLFRNATEWTIPRDILHTRRRGLELLYDRHTPQHHVIYVTGDMAIRGSRELQ